MPSPPSQTATRRAAPLSTWVAAALLALLLAACGAADGARGGRAEGTTYRLYFLGGQSNMDGYGFSAELPTDASGVVPRAMIFAGQAGLDGDPRAGLGVWQPLGPGFGTGFVADRASVERSDRFGPELFFGRTLAMRRPGEHVAVVKYAMGGTALAAGVGYGSWHPDGSDGAGQGQYGHALRALRGALSVADIDRNGRPDRLVPAGIVWMQGEADAVDSQAAADAYGANLGRLMSLLRDALGAGELPVVVGKITDSGMADDGAVMDYAGTVQAAQAAFAADDPCAALVTATDGLGYLDDGWHYDTDGVVRLGVAFAEAMLALEARCGATPAAP